MKLPKVGDFDARALDLLVSTEALCRDADAASVARLDDWLDGDPVRTRNTGALRHDELTHRLSPWMGGADDATHAQGRSLLEMRALARLELPPARAVVHEGADAFANTLVAVARAVGEDDAALRRGPVASLRDANGVRIVYPAPGLIRPRLDEIRDYARAHIAECRALVATVAMVAIMNVHPFGDGNGRVARVVFNWMMLERARRFAYLPLSELAALSDGGFLLRLREAQYFGRWNGLVQFIHLAASRLFGSES